MCIKKTIFLAIAFFSATAWANDICLNVKSERISDNSIKIEINGHRSLIKATHSIVDFSISNSGNFIVVYGGYYPKSMHGNHETYEISSAASVFRTKTSRRALKTVVVGRGVYEVLFDSNEHNIYIVARYGTIKVDTVKFHTENLGMDFEKTDFDQYSGACKKIHLSHTQ